MKLSLVLFMAMSAVAGTNSSLQFIQITSSQTTGIVAKGVLPLPNGSVAIFGNQTMVSGCSNAFATIGALPTCTPGVRPLLVTLDAAGVQTGSVGLGSGNSTIIAAAVDASGNIWITGETDSDDFPLLNSLYTQKADYKAIGFIAKIGPAGTLFSSYLAGTPTALAVDSTGNAYLAGTAGNSYPVTGPPFGPTATNSSVGYTFITKIASDGSKVLYSRLLGGTLNPCTGGIACIGVFPMNVPSVIAVDATGTATLAGQTYTTNFPVTTGAYSSSGAAFVSRISADGSTLLWSTTLGVTPPAAPQATELASIQGIALDSAANVYVAGSSFAPIPTTANALQATYQTTGAASGFVLKLSSDATQLLFATNLGGAMGSSLTGLTLDSASNLWVTGFTKSPDFPGLTATTAGLDFALELNARATAIQQINPLLPQTVTQPPAFDSNGNLLLLGAAGNLLRMLPGTAPSVAAFANAAVPAAVASIAPGEIMTVYGTNLGPATEIVGTPDSTGYYPTSLGGVSILIGGFNQFRYAPLLYVGPNQINFEVPPALALPSTVTITTPTGALPAMTPLNAGSLGIFGVVNADGIVNSATNPAKEGSIISIYLTGFGIPGGPYNDGAISTTANSAFGDVLVNWNNAEVPSDVLYAGTAPGLIDGLDQVNVQLPASTQNPVLTVVAPYYSQPLLTVTSNSVVVYAQ